ncbi:MAG: hypothetical protein C0609_02155 [Deltaproteobacteria bacterium]|nr:MAG: hypothetical protein C0609_02155 [Deltaproteobacteria bacterium]
MNVGVRIRRMREAQDLSIEQVAEITGLDASYIEAIERGDEIPPIGVVIKTSRALGSRMGQIIHGGGPSPDIFSICKEGIEMEHDRTGRDIRPRQGYSYKSLLSENIRGQAMEPFLVTFNSDAAETVQPMSHEGEEFIYLLSGTLELVYDDDIYTLKAGESAYIDSSRPHAFKGKGEPSPTAIAVIFSKS